MSDMKQDFSTYKKINTMGMSQLDLILTVYRGAIAYLDRAQSDFKEDKLTEGRVACEKARKCIVHLYTTLDMEKGQEIASQLAQLYVFMIQQIDLATASKSCDLIKDVKEILGTIKEAWESLKEQEGISVPAGPSEPIVEKTAEVLETPPASIPPPNGTRLTFSA
jgi:flagellar protein FliS